MSVPTQRKLRIAFLHPDLGIGGAERLVVDAALCLQRAGHTVHMYTSHHDENHCFEETRDGTLNVRVFGDSLPASILGKGHIICASLRNLFAAGKILANWIDEPYDVMFIDQLSISIPLFLFADTKVYFYCHFPDMLLAQRGSLLKRFYRVPFDALEQVTTGVADTIVVNSRFTASVFARTFARLHATGVRPAVLYPSIDFAAYDDNRKFDDLLTQWWIEHPPTPPSSSSSSTFAISTSTAFPPSPSSIPSFEAPIDTLPPSTCLLVSINRYERKKDIGLAIKAFALSERPACEEPREDDELFGKSALSENAVSPRVFSGLRGEQRLYSNSKLMIAGGWDDRVPENVEYYQELWELTLSQKLTPTAYPDFSGDVIFLRSFSQSQRCALLRRATAIVYTPQNEHFGIVPLEAMYSGRPVIACNSGGPLESIVHEKTGFLCAPTATEFAEAFSRIYSGEGLGMGEAARQHVVDKFSVDVFAQQLNTQVAQLAAGQCADVAGVSEKRRSAHSLGRTPLSRLAMLLNMMVFSMVFCIYLGIKFVQRFI